MDKLNTRGADQNTLKFPMVTTNAGMRTFTFTGAKEWKSLLKELRPMQAV